MGSLNCICNHDRNYLKEQEFDSIQEPSLQQQADSMHMVLPNIYLGSRIAAQNLKLLQSVGITHILSIGYDLTPYYPQQFTYLVLNNIEDRPGYLIVHKFSECFAFIDECVISFKSKILVHCHKGLSRSASVIIGYEMYTHKRSFQNVLQEIKQHRPYIMPNIGYQAQLQKFEECNYSLDFEKDWTPFDVMKEIRCTLHDIKRDIVEYYKMFARNDNIRINNEDLFAKTMYIHQVNKMRKRNKISVDDDMEALNDCIKYLRKIQEEYIKNPKSMHRFNVMFESKQTSDECNEGEIDIDKDKEKEKGEENAKDIMNVEGSFDTTSTNIIINGYSTDSLLLDAIA